jgi:hypothetical protein
MWSSMRVTAALHPTPDVRGSVLLACMHKGWYGPTTGARRHTHRRGTLYPSRHDLSGPASYALHVLFVGFLARGRRILNPGCKPARSWAWLPQLNQLLRRSWYRSRSRSPGPTLHTRQQQCLILSIIDCRRAYADKGGGCEAEEEPTDEVARASVTECDVAKRAVRPERQSIAET